MNGNYRSESPDIDSPPRDRHGDRDRYQGGSNYVKVSRDKDHRDYKRDKYSGMFYLVHSLIDYN